MMTHPKYSFLSSSLVKEIAHFNGDTTDLVSPEVDAALRRKFSGITPNKTEHSQKAAINNKQIMP